MEPCDAGIQVEVTPGWKVEDITKALKDKQELSAQTVTVLVGTNDVASEASAAEITGSFKTLVQEATRVSRQGVNISSILPRDDKRRSSV